MGHGPATVQQECEAALIALGRALPGSSVTGSREEWATAVRAAQRVVDVASAVQDVAIARLAAIEPELLEDGTQVESHRALGHVALDAPAIVSGALAVSAVHAQRRVRAAVLLAADGAAGSDSATGLRGLHAAMAEGRLDSYRAAVIADELGEAPPEVAAAVVTALDGYFELEDAAHLRRRCRRALARISPDLLVQRAQRARAESGLRRWADEPGVDRWEGTFPSEEAAQAWAAIDALAQRYVAEAVCATIERARAKALTDLVAGNATIETMVTVTVPATTLPDQGRTAAAESQSPLRAEHETRSEATSASVIAEEDLVEVGGLRAGDPVLVPRAWVASTVGADGHGQHVGSRVSVHIAQCHPVTGALLDTASDLPPRPRAKGMGGERPQTAEARADAYRPSPRVARRVRARDRRCRFPGCSVAAVFCDLDHVRPWPAGRTAHENLLCLCRRHHRVKQRPGWRVVLAADGVATWTDPTGRVRTTLPVDALRATVLPGAASIPRLPHASSRARTVLPDGPHTALEFLLEHLGAATTTPSTVWRDLHGRHCIEVTRRVVGATFTVDPGGGWPHRRTRPTERCGDTDEPPF